MGFFRLVLIFAILLAFLVGGLGCLNTDKEAPSESPTPTPKGIPFLAERPENGPSGDNTPPAISDIYVSQVTQSSVTINWTTDEPATSQVWYTNAEWLEIFSESDPFGQMSSLDASLTTSHSVTLTTLYSSSAHFYRVTSIDGSGNEAITEYTKDYNFTLDLTWIGMYYAVYVLYPEVPEWLAPLIPLDEGERLHPDTTVGIPSIQYWNSLLTSEQQKVLETVSWLGGDPDDYLEKVYASAPPSVGGVPDDTIIIW